MLLVSRQGKENSVSEKFQNCSGTHSAPPPPRVTSDADFLGSKMADHLIPSNTENMNDWIHVSTSSFGLHGLQTNKFTFLTSKHVAKIKHSAQYCLTVLPACVITLVPRHWLEDVTCEFNVTLLESFYPFIFTIIFQPSCYIFPN